MTEKIEGAPETPQEDGQASAQDFGWRQLGAWLIWMALTLFLLALILTANAAQLAGDEYKLAEAATAGIWANAALAGSGVLGVIGTGCAVLSLKE